MLVAMPRGYGAGGGGGEREKGGGAKQGEKAEVERRGTEKEIGVTVWARLASISI